MSNEKLKQKLPPNGIILLKILDVLDRIRKNTDRIANIAENKPKLPPKRDAGVDKLISMVKNIAKDMGN